MAQHRERCRQQLLFGGLTVAELALFLEGE
jgi:hypothetical protein